MLKFRTAPEHIGHKRKVIGWTAPGLTAIGLTLSLAGCVSVEPWVKPYQRGHLADPIMAFETDPVSTRYMNHVYESREASRGAEGSSGGGCGCN